MKIRNKKTGKIIEVDNIYTFAEDKHEKYDSLKEFNEEWEDYEEPKSGIESIRLNDMISGRHIVEIDFTKVEEAEKAVEKLKAWKRLKDKGFRLKNDSLDICCHTINFKVDRQFDMTDETSRDLHLLFGGELQEQENTREEIEKLRKQLGGKE